MYDTLEFIGLQFVIAAQLATRKELPVLSALKLVESTSGCTAKDIILVCKRIPML